ncbi:MAG TPA: hypothetical protein VK449_01830 [Anaerolineales bacterium]|nr:hypothetical protein [Anaerolineales bacterium]
MNTPALYLGILIASTIGFAFHALRGGTLARLALYLVTAWVAFFLGHALAGLMGWDAGRLGGLNLLPAIVATVIGLLAATLLAGPRRRRDPPRPPD